MFSSFYVKTYLRKARANAAASALADGKKPIEIQDINGNIIEPQKMQKCE
jgi:hypothetical protein